MAGLTGRRIVLGVTGGIAAYKAIEVCRRLVDLGAHVVPIMTATPTASSVRPRSPRSLPSLCTRRCGTTAIRSRTLASGSRPISWSSLPPRLAFSPRTRPACRRDLLTAVVIATRAPVIVCPAMHTEMWEHASVQENLATLRRRGVHVVDPESGRLAGGDIGSGRLASPETIVEHVQSELAPKDMAGLRVLVTAGGTREPIDAVRVIAQPVVGEARACARVRSRGSRRVGHGGHDRRHGLCRRVPRSWPSRLPPRWRPRSWPARHRRDVVVMAAAVADFRPKAAVDHKIKKEGGPPEIVLEPTPDILAGLGAAKRPGQTLVGFAAETETLRENAEGKLRRKRLDLIVANDVSAPGAGFEHDTNEVVILGEGIEQNVSLTDKRAVAAAVFDAVMVIREQERNP